MMRALYDIVSGLLAMYLLSCTGNVLGSVGCQLSTQLCTASIVHV